MGRRAGLNILVFEFITGGGLVQKELPESLAREGMLMLKTLISELTSLPFVMVTVLLDWRCKKFILSSAIKVVYVAHNQSIYALLPELINLADYVWPIAPEMNNNLAKISTLVETKNKILLNSSAQAATLCGDKLLTFQKLKQEYIAVVETYQLNKFLPVFNQAWVVKPKDGAGCFKCFFVETEDDFKQINKQIENKFDYIIQPYIKGEVLSLSCLFKHGKAWLLCVNRQYISIQQNHFVLEACEVNCHLTESKLYLGLINKIANGVMGLWGYVGIDIILTEPKQPLILEINPRLTTSYAGINQAIGVNVAKTVLEMLDSDPKIIKRYHKLITIRT